MAKPPGVESHPRRPLASRSSLYCFSTQVAILSIAAGAMVSSISEYSAGEPFLAVWKR